MSVVLSRVWICSAEIFGSVQRHFGPLVTNRERSTTGIEWIQVKDTAQHPRVHRTGPKTKDYPAKVSVLTLRNPALGCAFHGIFFHFGILLLYVISAFPFAFIACWVAKLVVTFPAILKIPDLVQIFPLSGCVSLDELLNVSEHQCPYF